jgi:FkbM family methyltransferase
MISECKPLHSALMRVRPAQLGDCLKRALRIRRKVVQSGAGHFFFADPVSDLGMPLANSGEYEPQMSKLLVMLLRSSDVFVDIGGHEGYFSVIAASRVVDGMVHCIEPQSRLLPLLQTNFKLNRSNVVIHQCAASNHDGHADLFLRPSTNTGASSMFRHWKLGSRVERVRCVTLDSLFRDHAIDRVRLMKVDCEGAEPLLVEGAKRVLRERLVEFIAMDYHLSIAGRQACLEAHRQIIDAGYLLSVASGQYIYHLPNGAEALRALGDVMFDVAFQDRTEV